MFQSHGVFGMAVVTLLTVQNTCGVERVQVLDGTLVEQQLRAVLQDIPPAAIKTGSLGSSAVIQAVTRGLDATPAHLRPPLVIDPVMTSKHGAMLVDGATEAAFREHLLPRASLLTPNLREAERLLDRRIQDLAELERAAGDLHAMGPRYVLLKGGVLPTRNDAVDVLVGPDGMRVFVGRRLLEPSRHGAGCFLSAAVTARLALGQDMEQSVAKGLELIARAMESGAGLGQGIRPLDPFCEPTI